MLKKLCLSTTFIALSFASTDASTNRIAAIQDSLVHIAQAKKDINTEKETVISLNKSAQEYIDDKHLGHMIDVIHYEELKKEIHSILDQITSNDEFINTINYLTDFQITCIVNKHMAYNDIEYTPESYPLEQKTLMQRIDTAIASSSIPSHTDGELLFNIYYLQATQNLGYKLLLEKLTLKKQELITEFTSLEATNQTTNE